MTQQYIGAALASKIAAEEWASDFADLLTVFDAEQVNRSLFGAFATTHRQDQPVQYDELCRVFIDLVDRGVLVPEFKSDLADEGLNEMRALAGKAAAPKPAPPPTPEEVKARDINQCATDFHTLSGAAFKSKWLGIKRDVYEAAFQAGRI